MKSRKKAFFVFFILVTFVSIYYTIGHAINKKTLSIQAYTLQTSFDNVIPLIPIFVIIYFSMYIMAVVPCLYVHDKKNFIKLVQAYLLTLFSSFFLFAIFPVKMIRPEITGNTLMEKLLAFLYSVDTPYNNFPSLHVALSFLAYFYVWKYNKKHNFLILSWVILISLSILFVKQHYFLDLIAGILLAMAVFLFFERKSL